MPTVVFSFLGKAARSTLPSGVSNGLPSLPQAPPPPPPQWRRGVAVEISPAAEPQKRWDSPLHKGGGAYTNDGHLSNFLATVFFLLLLDFPSSSPSSAPPRFPIYRGYTSQCPLFRGREGVVPPVQR